MIKLLKHYASVFSCSAKLAIQEQLEYPWFLVGWVIAIPLSYLTGILLLYVLVDQFQPLAGWTFPQLAFIYGLGDLSHGIMVTFCIQAWQIEFFVTNGEFDRMLLRPMNIFFQFIVNYINFIGLVDLVVGGVIFIYASRYVDFQWSAANSFRLLAVIIGGAAIRSSFYMIVGSVAFWTKRSWALIKLGQNLMERTTLYPLSIYPKLIQGLLTFLIPIGFISFYPACEFLHQDDRFSIPLGLAVWTPIVGLVTLLLANFVFRTGLNKYESSGS